MYCLTSNKFQIIFVFFITYFASNAAYSETVSSLLQGLEYRKNIIQTGIFDYSFFIYEIDNANFLSSRTDKRNNLLLTSADYVLTLSGNEWSESDRNGVVRFLRDSRYKYTFLDSGNNGDNTIAHVLEIQPADYTFEEHAKLHPDFRIVHGGTVPWSSLMSYFLQHESEFRRESGVTIESEQTGEKYELLELTIPQENYSALVTASTLLSNAPFMKVRLYISPNKGYVIRRLDYMTADGKFWGHRFESTDFREVSDGIWLPINYKIIFDQNTGQGNDKISVWEYSVKKVSRVNEPILGTDFDLLVPKGTTVYDETGRGGELITFIADDNITLANIDDMVKDAIRIKEESQIKKSIAATRDWDFIFRIILFCLGCFSLVIACWLTSRKKITDV
jgi:hypothetical protein